MMKSHIVRLMAVLALGLCSACNSTATTKTAQMNQATQLTSVQWDMAVAAQNAASVSNKGLIMMR